ncbi:hypothetical protein GCM10010442_79010 [Kitasatospora kifunensis]
MGEAGLWLPGYAFVNVCTKMVSVLSRHSDAHHAMRRRGATIVAHRGRPDQKFDPKPRRIRARTGPSE